jgi:hypothetical protein
LKKSSTKWSHLNIYKKLIYSLKLPLNPAHTTFIGLSYFTTIAALPIAPNIPAAERQRMASYCSLPSKARIASMTARKLNDTISDTMLFISYGVPF